MVDPVKVKNFVTNDRVVSFHKKTWLRRQDTDQGYGGFTIVELIIVVAIVAILALMSIPVFSEYTIRTKNKRCIAELRTIDQAITSFILDKNTLPPTATGLSDVGMGLKDPWTRSYVYTNLSDGTAPLQDSALQPLNTDYDLYSLGINGNTDTLYSDPKSQDDIVRVHEGSTYVMREEM